MTADQLLQLRLPGKRAELVKGVLVVRQPASYRHGEVTVRLTKALVLFVDAHDLGRVLAAETGFKLETSPDTVRAPDVAFVSKARIPSPAPKGYAPFAPDLAVEVLSPDDRPGEVLAKVADWLRADSRLVWVVDPGRRLARVYRAEGTESLLEETDALEGEDVLPGFSCQLAEVFSRLAAFARPLWRPQPARHTGVPSA